MKNSIEQCASVAMDVTSHSEFLRALRCIAGRKGRASAGKIEKRLDDNACKVLSLLMDGGPLTR